MPDQTSEMPDQTSEMPDQTSEMPDEPADFLARIHAANLCSVFNETGATSVRIELSPPEEQNNIPGSRFLVTVERVCACERCEEKRDEEAKLKALDNEDFDPIIHED